ncbi:MAG: SNF2-related protein [Pyrinomonadaceae bacterium MAG19_C2-C3]|nr:SNF2-related protein [Pyrinomonadaceae bacterium MAG19_C2-C3]
MDLPAELDALSDTAAEVPLELGHWKRKLYDHLERREPKLLDAVLPALNAYPADGELLLLAAVAALLENKPEQSLRFQHRFAKRYRPFEAELLLLQAVALAQGEKWVLAWGIVGQHGTQRLQGSIRYLPCARSLAAWFRGWLGKIERAEGRRVSAHAAPQKHVAQAFIEDEKVKSASKSNKSKGNATRRAAPVAAHHPPDKTLQSKINERVSPVATVVAASSDSQLESEIPANFLAPLARLESDISFSFEMPPQFDDVLDGEANNVEAVDEAPDNELTAFRLRYDLTHLGLLQGFDELLCLPALRGVDVYWYQTEAARKVLKQFRGRVLLADEVGLGKTIEAGMVLKEYILRGMAKRVLILTPATLVGQWQEELRVKFDLDFATSYDRMVRDDAESFWAQPQVIASIATARRPEHFEILTKQTYDLVIVDEAHHLKNRTTQNWKLVNALQKRFLLLLSATPVQNSLVELYNLLTLLKPGIFKTEKEFRQSYMTQGKPRVPLNRERMRDLMRDVMIRNTRSLVDVRLPARHAVTLRLEAGGEEAACYAELSRLIQHEHQGTSAPRRLSLRHLLAAAGSSPAAAGAAVTRFAANHKVEAAWRTLARRYAQLERSAKEVAVLDLLRRNPEEKKLVFVHHRDSLARLAALLEAEGNTFARFEGAMSGVEKDAAINRFRDEVAILLSTESGGEGRNLQFCNTLVNFDLPWNPMAIEQRIGRIHRIGQTREVFIFNLAVKDTLEDQVLRILDEKINMFELVVGEIDLILGEMSDESEFSELVFAAWVETTEAGRDAVFERLGAQLIDAKSRYEAVKQLDEELFGDEFVAG